MIKRKTSKPKILKHKVELANLIKAKWDRKEYAEHPQSYYWWRGIFYSENGINIYIYFQNYVRRRNRGKVDFVHLRYNDCDGRALYPTEVKELIESINEAQ